MKLRKWLAPVVGVAIFVALTGCANDSNPPNTSKSGDTMNSSTTDLVCGLVSADLVRKVVGDATIDSRGAGADVQADEPAQCRIQDGDRGQTVMQVSIGKVDPAKWARTLATEAEESTYGDCAKRYDGDPGVGYGCTYDSGVFVAGAGVNVLKGDHLIRATVYNWLDASPEQRLALAEDVARDLDRNYRPAAH